MTWSDKSWVIKCETSGTLSTLSHILVCDVLWLKIFSCQVVWVNKADKYTMSSALGSSTNLKVTELFLGHSEMMGNWVSLVSVIWVVLFAHSLGELCLWRKSGGYPTEWTVMSHVDFLWWHPDYFSPFPCASSTSQVWDPLEELLSN